MWYTKRVDFTPISEISLLSENLDECSIQTLVDDLIDPWQDLHSFNKSQALKLKQEEGNTYQLDYINNFNIAQIYLSLNYLIHFDFKNVTSSLVLDKKV